MNVEFKVENLNVLVSALSGLKWRHEINDNVVTVWPPNSDGITLDLVQQRASFLREDQGCVNALKRAYSWQAVQIAARAKGWAVQGTPSKGYIVKV